MSSSAALHAFSERFLADHFDAHPIYAAFLGFHEYDGRVPDLSQEALEKRAVYLQQALDDVNGIETDQFEPVDWLDFQLLRDAIQFELFDLTEWRRWQIDPQTYLWPLGVDQYIKRNYAPLAERAQGLIQHLRHAPELVQQAKANLDGVPAPGLETATRMLKGIISFLEEDLRLALEELKESDPTLHGEFQTAQRIALDVEHDPMTFMTQTLAPQAPSEFAIGVDAFGKMLCYGEAVDVPLERLLEIGQIDLARNKTAFIETATRIAPNKTPAEVVQLLSKEHPTVETLVQDTQDMLEELRQWIIDHDIVSVPYDDRCIAAETPKFMRRAFAMMDSAGPFESSAREAYYYVTPPEPDWPPQKQEEWLTQFDYHALRDTSIH